MEKPRVQLRKPPTPASPDAFVRGETPETPERSDAQTSKRRTLERVDGRKVRRFTLYLPAELAERLAVHCARTGRDLSDVAAEALERLGV